MLRCQVDFSKTLRPWDGFGVNYVEVAQSRDYTADPQDYGGFSVLAEADRHAILDLIFGEEGLRPAIIKMFLDPFHQPEPGVGYRYGPETLDMTAYDHATTTHWMRMFAREGLHRTRARGDDLQVFVTLYGPPPWMTKQRSVRGRDLDPEFADECAKYMISWAKFLRESEGLPVRYISLHNEGEDWERWPVDGRSGAGESHHDHNMFWPPEQVVDFIRRMQPMLERFGLADVGVTPGEATNWYRFAEWGYADAIADDAEALANLGLITSHGFSALVFSRWYADWRSSGIDTLRERRPELRAWVTSTGWAKMDALFVNEIRNNIYAAKVNAIVPWACVQRHSLWVGGDPNPGTAVVVHDDGSYQVQPGYYFYKQVCLAGQAGMAVARVHANDSEIGLIAFAKNGTKHPDAVIVINMSKNEKILPMYVQGSASTTFQAYRTSPTEQYTSIGEYTLDEAKLLYTAPPGSVTTFYGAQS
jgi:hypothetical protein